MNERDPNELVTVEQAARELGVTLTPEQMQEAERRLWAKAAQKSKRNDALTGEQEMSVGKEMRIEALEIASMQRWANFEGRTEAVGHTLDMMIADLYRFRASGGSAESGLRLLDSIDRWVCSNSDKDDWEEAEEMFDRAVAKD